MRQSLLIRAGACEIDLRARELRVAGRPCPVEPRVFSLLAYLAQRPDRVVTRQELLRGVWPGQQVSDAALARAVMKARQALGDTSDASPIRTVQRVGYRFVGERADGPGPMDSRQVAILPFDNATGEASLDWVSLGLMSLVAGAIGREPGLATVAISTLLTALDGARATGADPVASVRAATGVELVVNGQVTHRGADYGLRLDCPGIGVVQVQAPTPGELGPLGARALAERLRPGTDRPPAGPHEANPLATTAFARALQAQAQQRFGPAVNLLRMAEMLSPGSTPVRLELLRALCSMADLAPARPIARGLLAEAQRLNDGLLTARVHMALARAHMYAQAFEPCIDHVEQSLYWLGEHGPAEEVARAHLTRAHAAFFIGDYAACELALERMRLPTELSGNRLLSISRCMMLAYIARIRSELERSAELMAQAVHDAHEIHSLRDMVAAGSNASTDLVGLGRWSEAATHAEQAFAVALQLNDRISICTAVVSGSWVYMVLGVPAAAQRMVDALPPDDGLSTLERLWATSARSHAAASAGRHAEAVEFFIRALRLLRGQGNRLNEADVLPWLVRSLVLCGRFDEAEAELAAGRPLAGRLVWGHLQHCDALLAHARGEPERALQSLRCALDDADTVPMWRAWAAWDAAWLLAEAGSPGEAQEMLKRSPPGFETLPLASLVAARVQFAQGEFEKAQHAHRQYLSAARHGLVPPYFASLGEGFAAGQVARAPFLPSRL